MVEPRDLDAVRQDPDVAQAMASGAFLLAVPLIAMTGRTVKANVTLDAGLLKAIDAVARSRHITRSALIADALRRELV